MTLKQMQSSSRLQTLRKPTENALNSMKFRSLRNFTAFTNFFHEHLKNQMQLRTLTNALARTVCVAANFFNLTS